MEFGTEFSQNTVGFVAHGFEVGAVFLNVAGGAR